jgi:hypothetical protein
MTGDRHMRKNPSRDVMRKNRYNYCLVWPKSTRGVDPIRLIEPTPDNIRWCKRAWDRVEKRRFKSRIESSHFKAAKRQRTPKWANREKIRAIYRECRERSKVTGVPHHVDHIVPLRGALVCGLHVEHNLAIIPATGNLKKGPIHENDRIEWFMLQHPRLFKRG